MCAWVPPCGAPFLSAARRGWATSFLSVVRPYRSVDYSRYRSSNQSLFQAPGRRQTRQRLKRCGQEVNISSSGAPQNSTDGPFWGTRGTDITGKRGNAAIPEKELGPWE